MRIPKRLRTTCTHLPSMPYTDNFVRIHQALRVTPAMEAGIWAHVWTMEELVGLVG